MQKSWSQLHASNESLTLQEKQARDCTSVGPWDVSRRQRKILECLVARTHRIGLGDYSSTNVSPRELLRTTVSVGGVTSASVRIKVCRWVRWVHLSAACGVDLSSMLGTLAKQLSPPMCISMRPEQVGVPRQRADYPRATQDASLQLEHWNTATLQSVILGTSFSTLGNSAHVPSTGSHPSPHRPCPPHPQPAAAAPRPGTRSPRRPKSLLVRPPYCWQARNAPGILDRSGRAS